jgi:uncharacterized Zn ribbon protein
MRYKIGKNGAVSELSCCPHCQSEYGYYRTVRMSGESDCHYNFDGSETDNSQLHDHLDYKEKKTMFCRECRKPIGQVETK